MTQNATPSFKWAERDDKLFVTVEITDATNVVVKLDTTHFHLECTRKGDDNTKYSLDFELAKSINAAESTYAVRARQIEFVLIKDEASEGYWNALLKDKNQYKGRVKIDWDLYRDEDEEDDKAMPADFGQGGPMGGMGGAGGMPGGMDFSQMMGGMGGGAGGMGGMDFSSMLAGMGQGGGAGGMPDFGNMGGDAPDSDDEDEIPGLDVKDDEEETK